MDNREGTIVSNITYKNNRFTCYAKKLYINLTNSMFACLICRSLFFINRLHKKNLLICKSIMLHLRIVITLSLLPIALYVSMIQHSIC